MEGDIWAQQIDFLKDLISDNIQISIHTYRPLDYTFNFEFYQGAWYHLAIVRTNNRLRAYVNGAEIGSDAQKGIDVSQAGSINSVTSVNGDYVRIGEDFNGNDYWGFYLCYVLIAPQII